MAKKTNEPDWEAIEAAYRANIVSIRAIAAAHGVSDTAIHKRAKAEGWQRDLSEKVRRTVRDEIARADGLQGGLQDGLHERKPQTIPDAAIVDIAARIGVDVVMSHRKDISQLHALKRILADRLAMVLNGEQPDGPCLGTKETPSDLLEKLSRVTHRLVPLERKAHNLDADNEPPSSGDVPIILEGMLRELAARRERLTGETPE